MVPDGYAGGTYSIEASTNPQCTSSPSSRLIILCTRQRRLAIWSIEFHLMSIIRIRLTSSSPGRSAWNIPTKQARVKATE